MIIYKHSPRAIAMLIRAILHISRYCSKKMQNTEYGKISICIKKKHCEHCYKYTDLRGPNAARDEWWTWLLNVANVVEEKFVRTLSRIFSLNIFKFKALGNTSRIHIQCNEANKILEKREGGRAGGWRSMGRLIIYCLLSILRKTGVRRLHHNQKQIDTLIVSLITSV